MDDPWADLRFAVRLLVRSPGFALVAILALALGIGANTAIFSAVDAVLLRPLPYGDAERLAIVWEDASYIGFPQNTPAVANFLDWKKQNQVFTDMAASRGRSCTLTGYGSPEFVNGRGTTANIFSVLGVQPILGRTYTEEEDRSGADVVVISYGLWQRHYGGNRNIVGKPIQMDGHAFTVLGVMPSGFHFPSRKVDLGRRSTSRRRNYTIVGRIT